MTPAQAHHALLETPDHFLNQCNIQIAGSAPSAVVPYTIGYRRDRAPAPAPAPLGGILMFRLDPSAAPMSEPAGQHPFLAHCVEMVNYDTLVGPAGPGIGAINAYTLPGPGGAPAGNPDIMVTGELSGCTFCVLQVGATVLCAHIQPPAALPPGAAVPPAAAPAMRPASWLHTQLTAHGRFAGHPGSPLVCFGRNAYVDRANIVGVRLRDPAGVVRWHIYAQHTDFERRITGYTQII